MNKDSKIWEICPHCDTEVELEFEMEPCKSRNMIKELVIRMEVEVVDFCFQKKNGEIRKAKGTLRKDMCPKVNGTGKPTPEHLQLYFDVEKGSWRSFEKERFIEMY